MQRFFKKYFNQQIHFDNYKSVFEHILYQEDNQKDPVGFSPNFFQGRKNYIPNIIVCHINNTYASAIKHFYEEHHVSSHFIIRKDGHIKQIVSLDNSAWANGTSISSTSDVYYKLSTSKYVQSIPDNANYFTFSIEHESFDGSLTPQQILSSVKVMKQIIQYVKEKYNYDFEIDRNHIIGHDEVNPIVRKKCPGHKFPFQQIINMLKEN